MKMLSNNFALTRFLITLLKTYLFRKNTSSIIAMINNSFRTCETDCSSKYPNYMLTHIQIHILTTSINTMSETSENKKQDTTYH